MRECDDLKSEPLLLCGSQSATAQQLTGGSLRRKRERERRGEEVGAPIHNRCSARCASQRLQESEAERPVAAREPVLLRSAQSHKIDHSACGVAVDLVRAARVALRAGEAIAAAPPALSCIFDAAAEHVCAFCFAKPAVGALQPPALPPVIRCAYDLSCFSYLLVAAALWAHGARGTAPDSPAR